MTTRIISGVVMMALTVAAVWLAPTWLFLVIAVVLVGLGCHEFEGLARASGLRIPLVV